MRDRKGLMRLCGICCVGIMLMLGAGTAMAGAPVIQVPSEQPETAGGPGTEERETGTVRIQAVVRAVEDDGLLVENQSEVCDQGEIFLKVNLYDSRIVDGADGHRRELSDIQIGDVIYADIDTAITCSLPPQTTAQILLCGMTEGERTPEYLICESIKWQEDENWRLVSTAGTEYHVPKDCPVIAYSDDELSAIRIISKSSKLLVWTGEDGQVNRIVKLPLRW